MASLHTDTRTLDEICPSPLPPHPALESLVHATAEVTLQDVDTPNSTANESTSSRLPAVYNRAQILSLRRSPLVKPPDGMPALKDWFGDWSEQQTAPKKDLDASNVSSNARERRFRRDPEDGDSSRASFRSALTQPSQMGNFRHQSIRTTERDKDRDLERERERDLREKEGQERLRNLSDKYDRDRLALSSTTNNLRNKERDSAPHLASTAATRLGQGQSTATTRRNDPRETTRRKAGESSDDWRRGPDTTRATREDTSGTDATRKDRDRPRSRVRESSRARRETSPSRRDREDKDSGRRGDDFHRREWDDFYNRSDRDRDDHTRDNRDRYRPRDPDRDPDDDPRRWRDDGKREERMTVRRDRERDRAWDRHEDRDRERPDERDGRTRRGGRERRLGGLADDGKDKDERRDRDKDREPEPAWMETYVPMTPGGGILGGRSGDGELDGIQAWKKGMKEREQQQKENGRDVETRRKSQVDQITSDAVSSDQVQSPAAPESQLDEIQLFKLMMKREAQKKEDDKPPTSQPEVVAANIVSTHSETAAVAGESEKIYSSGNLDSLTTSLSQAADTPLQRSTSQSAKLGNDPFATDDPQRSRTTTSTANGAQSFLSALVSSAHLTSGPPNFSTPSQDQLSAGPRLLTSRVIPTASPSGVSPSTTHTSDIPFDNNNTTPSTFNPPAGSRLLAFGSRVPSGGSAAGDVFPSKSHSALDSGVGQFPPPGVSGVNPHKFAGIPSSISTHATAQDPVSGLGVDAHFGTGPRNSPLDTSRVMRSFSPHNPQQPSSSFDEMRDSPALGQFQQMNDLRRASAVERAAFGLPNEGVMPFNDVGAGAGGLMSGGPLDMSGANVPGGAGYAAGKGSRFAKFFDAKTRDGQPMTGRKGPGLPGMQSSSPIPDGRPLGGGLNGIPGTNGEARTMEDIFAMLQNSTQVQRPPSQIPPSGRVPSGGSPFGQHPPELLNVQQQMHPQPHYSQNSHLDALYDSRFDDRNFVPDGMVPGLRPAPPRSRSREPSGVLFNEQLDDPLHFNVRLQQQRNLNLEQLYNGPNPALYNQQQAALLRNGGIPIQQQQFRGAPSPIANQNTMGGPPQRLPPGLANLGGRPPHDPSQYIGGPMGASLQGAGLQGGLQGGLHGGSPVQQPFNNFVNGGTLGYGVVPQARGPPGPQNPLGLPTMAGLGLQGNIDLRAASQAQLLGVGGGLRGQGPGFAPQHIPTGQPSVAHLGVRQQQQQQLPPHMMPHMIPPHLQPQHGLPGGNPQGAQDLMALLMGGHRD
ncbi:hypothetical protein IEO21_00378 [Rhodonia placenta]|uniref:Uncharacterized protein n=1 Tax=Rhodonia placenta TaxID=104341 RepID=A0A8H7PBX9_9APHY|nr:hypothetical protein IEO21_00378 [Postia placenta]